MADPFAKIRLWFGRDGAEHFLGLGERLVVGRGEGVGIRLTGWRASRRHVILELQSDGLYATDLGSRNGTTIAGVRAEPHHAVRVNPTSRIVIGDHVITHEIQYAADVGKTSDFATLPLLDPQEFEILGPCGKGAVGQVWAARQLLLDRLVAVKALRYQLQPGTEGYLRFLREAKLYTQIDCPFVVRLYDIRMVNGVPVLLMELVSGLTAADRLERSGPFPIPEALRLGEDIARALDAISRLGIVHRDVKPRNIMLSPEGMAKLADFGLALDPKGEELTKAGVGLGSIPFVSPEQIEDGHEVDVRADIYSLGATLHTLISGTLPFESGTESMGQLMRRIATQPVAELGALRPDCPPGVEDYVQRLLSKAPDDRPKSPMQVSEDLKALRLSCYASWIDGTLLETHDGDRG